MGVTGAWVAECESFVRRGNRSPRDGLCRTPTGNVAIIVLDDGAEVTLPMCLDCFYEEVRRAELRHPRWRLFTADQNILLQNTIRSLDAGRDTSG